MAGLTFTKNKRAYVSDLNNLALINRNAVRIGCEVIERSPQIMGIRVEVGTVFFGQTVVSVAEQDLNISASHASFDRWDLIVVSNTGIASVIEGTPEVEPHIPDYDPESYVVLARVFIDDLSIVVTTAKIYDIRCINEGIGTFGKYVETGIVSQTSIIINHNLNDTEPVVQCIDSTNTLVFPGSVDIDSDDQITVNFNPAFSGRIVIQGGAGSGGSGGGGASLTIKEQDGIPTVLNVDEIRVSNGTLTDLGSGDVSLDLTGRVGTYIHNQGTPGTVWTVNHNLGEQYVQVQVFDNLDEWVQPHSIVLDGANQLTITFLSSTAGKAIIKK